MERSQRTGVVVAFIAFIAFTGVCRADRLGASFVDDFGDLDRNRWEVSDGWSNGDWTNCTWSRRSVAVREGRLLLAFQPDPGKAGAYLCGEIQSKATYGHGTYEVLMKTGRGSGLNAAFFTYIGPVHGRPHHEIDVEVLLRNPSEVSFNTYIDGQTLNGRSVALLDPADEEFIHFAFVWRPDGIAWFVNREKVHETAPGAELPSEPQKLYASLWGTDTLSDWMGRFDPTTAPQILQIEFIAYTRLGEPCSFAASLVCHGAH